MSDSESFVAFPMRISNTPVANGSSVPAWPTLVLGGRNRLTRSTAAADDSLAGLSRLSTPSIRVQGFKGLKVQRQLPSWFQLLNSSTIEPLNPAFCPLAI